MSKVYVITRGNYSNYGIEKIFSTREAAEKYCAVDSDELDMPNIEEWDLEDGSDIQIDRIYKAIWFSRQYEASSYVDYQMRYGLTPFKLDIRKNRKEHGFTYYGISGYIPVSKTITDDEKAKKIIFDHLAKWKAEQLGL